MREIKFRAWDKKNKEYVAGFWIRFNRGKATFYHCNTPELEQPSPDDVILEQFTGLKDKNGTEIYEGDIVAIDERWGKHEIKCGNFCAYCGECNGHNIEIEMVGFYLDEGFPEPLQTDEVYEVIGTIHDKEDSQ